MFGQKPPSQNPQQLRLKVYHAEDEPFYFISRPVLSLNEVRRSLQQKLSNKLNDDFKLLVEDRDGDISVIRSEGEWWDMLREMAEWSYSKGWFDDRLGNSSLPVAPFGDPGMNCWPSKDPRSYGYIDRIRILDAQPEQFANSFNAPKQNEVIRLRAWIRNRGINSNTSRFTSQRRQHQSQIRLSNGDEGPPSNNLSRSEIHQDAFHRQQKTGSIPFEQLNKFVISSSPSIVTLSDSNMQQLITQLSGLIVSPNSRGGDEIRQRQAAQSAENTAKCKACGVMPLKHPFYSCNLCKGFNLCNQCQTSLVDTKNIHPHFLMDKNHRLIKVRSYRANPHVVHPAQTVHSSVKCDGCTKKPIVGIRYKCVSCYNYDLCEECEANSVHKQHSMYQIL